MDEIFAIHKFCQRVCKLALEDLSLNGIDILLRHTQEELGEFAAALSIEQGVKNKPLRESSKVESLDTVICALSLYYASGGTNEELETIGQQKLDKWEKRL